MHHCCISLRQPRLRLQQASQFALGILTSIWYLSNNSLLASSCMARCHAAQCKLMHDAVGMQAFHAQADLALYTAGMQTATDVDITASSAAAGNTMAARQTSANSPVAIVPAGRGPAPNSHVAQACVGTGPVASVSPANAAAVQGMTAGNGPAFTDPAEEEYSSDEEYDSFSDNDLSSWGSMDEVWDADSDYYDAEEEEEALAGTDAHSTMCQALNRLVSW